MKYVDILSVAEWFNERGLTAKDVNYSGVRAACSALSIENNAQMNEVLLDEIRKVMMQVKVDLCL